MSERRSEPGGMAHMFECTECGKVEDIEITGSSPPDQICACGGLMECIDAADGEQMPECKEGK